MSLVSKLNEDRSIKIPEEILKRAGFKPGIEIIWLYDEDTSQILLMEKPKNFAKTMKGLGKELWQDVDINTYIKEERESWE
jgi:bifunctional DNA-binding transcriptional regulator/antitoxin component of YhaV-PrlF toxin-antitoxin module